MKYITRAITRDMIQKARSAPTTIGLRVAALIWAMLYVLLFPPPIYAKTSKFPDSWADK